LAAPNINSLKVMDEMPMLDTSARLKRSSTCGGLRLMT
jgi:hypothetical protein